jgi:hypothetical protein
MNSSSSPPCRPGRAAVIEGQHQELVAREMHQVAPKVVGAASLVEQVVPSGGQDVLEAAGDLGVAEPEQVVGERPVEWVSPAGDEP